MARGRHQFWSFARVVNRRLSFSCIFFCSVCPGSYKSSSPLEQDNFKDVKTMAADADRMHIHQGTAVTAVSYPGEKKEDCVVAFNRSSAATTQTGAASCLHFFCRLLQEEPLEHWRRPEGARRSGYVRPEQQALAVWQLGLQLWWQWLHLAEK
jgi:hypothetical protein